MTTTTPTASPSRILHDMSEREYHLTAGASASRLKSLLTKTPAHLRWELDNPPADTAAFRVGRLLHCMALTPDLVRANFMPAPDVDRRTKAGKELYEQALLQAGNRTLISTEEWDQCDNMARAVRATGLLEKGQPEVSLFCEINGVKSKARFDWWNEGQIIDVKTTATVGSPRDFQRTVWNFGYGLQAAWYTRMARACGLNPTGFTFIVVEKDEPHVTGVYDLDEAVITLFDKQIDDLLVEYKASLADVPPAATWGRHTIKVPTWAMSALEDEV